MRLGSKYYRRLQSDLDKIGITTSIYRSGSACYQFIVNYEVKKQYKTRRPCNRQLTILHKEKVKTDEH